MKTAKETDANLKERWAQFKTENPNVRIRDAAEKLSVSEGELLATGIGENVVRLQNDFKKMLHELYKLGRMMALTRNDEIVHERKGIYENAQTNMPHKMALFVNPDIDLRIFLKNWHHAFAVTIEKPNKTLYSIQIFDQFGSAVHKIYTTNESDLAAYENLVEKFKADDQTANLKAKQKDAKKADKSDAEIDVENFRKAWAEMKDTHDFFPLISNFGVGRKQALRLAEDRFAKEVPAESFKILLKAARDRKVPIMIFVGNGGIIQIHTGEIENLTEARGWFNILDENFNLHVKQNEIDAAFIVRKPTEDGIITSLELFNKNDENVALFFGKRKPGMPEREDWRELAEEVRNEK